MNIVIGSKNPCKVETAKKVLADYYPGALVFGAQVGSGVSKQPIGLAEMIRGAQNRACNAMIPIYDMSIGLESGVFHPLRTTKDTLYGWWDACVCVVRLPNGQMHNAMSAAFPIPPPLMERILFQNEEISDAVTVLGGDESLRTSGGLCSLITRGRMTREDQVRQALIGALTHLDGAEFFQPVSHEKLVNDAFVQEKFAENALQRARERRRKAQEEFSKHVKKEAARKDGDGGFYVPYPDIQKAVEQNMQAIRESLDHCCPKCGNGFPCKK